jgi:hypothetical protein
MPEQDTKGRFLTGNIGGPGRPKGSRNKLGEVALAMLHDDFVQHGVGVIEQVRLESPATYLKVVASVIPSELNVNVSQLQELSDEDLALLAQFIEMKTIEHEGTAH